MMVRSSIAEMQRARVDDTRAITPIERAPRRSIGRNF